MRIRWRMLCIAMVIMLIGSGCTSNKTSETIIAGIKDGTYLGAVEFSDNEGWAPFLRIGIENGKIRWALFDYVHVDGRLGSMDEVFNTHFTDMSGESFGSVSQGLVDRLVEQQSIQEESTSSASEHGIWFKKILEAILTRAKNGDTRPVLITPDIGTYFAEDEPDEQGWIGRVTVNFERQTVVSIHYDEIRLEDNAIVAKKSDDKDYAQSWKETNDMDFEQVVTKLTTQLIHEGRASGVDVISGATKTSRRFRILAQKAMGKRVPVDFIALLKIQP